MNNAQAERWVQRRKQGAPKGPKGPMGKQGDAQRTNAVSRLQAIRKRANNAGPNDEKQLAQAIKQIGLFLGAAARNDAARAQGADSFGLTPDSLQEFGRQEGARRQMPDSYGLGRRSLAEFDRQQAARSMGADDYGLDQRYVDAFEQEEDDYGLSPRSLMEWRRQQAARRQPADTYGLESRPMMRPMRGYY